MKGLQRFLILYFQAMSEYSIIEAKSSTAKNKHEICKYVNFRYIAFDVLLTYILINEWYRELRGPNEALELIIAEPLSGFY